MNYNFLNHIEKINKFIRRQIRREILNGHQIFDSIKGVLPKNKMRYSFDANLKKCRFSGNYIAFFITILLFYTYSYLIL